MEKLYQYYDSQFQPALEILQTSTPSIKLTGGNHCDINEESLDALTRFISKARKILRKKKTLVLSEQ